MGNLAVVDGIEKLGGMRGLSLKCDRCDTHFSGGNGRSKAGPVMPAGYYGIGIASKLAADAANLGWEGVTKYRQPSAHCTYPDDICPNCVSDQTHHVDPNAFCDSAFTHTHTGQAQDTTDSFIFEYASGKQLRQRHALNLNHHTLNGSHLALELTNWPKLDINTQWCASIEIKLTWNTPLIDLFILTPVVPLGGVNRKAAPTRLGTEELFGLTGGKGSALLRFWSWGDEVFYFIELLYTDRK